MQEVIQFQSTTKQQIVVNDSCLWRNEFGFACSKKKRFPAKHTKSSNKREGWITQDQQQWLSDSATQPGAHIKIKRL